MFRPHHVEADQRDAVAHEELVDELGHEMSAPRPVAELAEALLVDVEDDDAPLDAARHGHRQPRVVDQVVELGDETARVEAKRLAYQKEHDRKAESDPYEVLSQRRPFRPSGRIPS